MLKRLALLQKQRKTPLLFSPSELIKNIKNEFVKSMLEKGKDGIGTSGILYNILEILLHHSEHGQKKCLLFLPFLLMSGCPGLPVNEITAASLKDKFPIVHVVINKMARDFRKSTEKISGTAKRLPGRKKQLYGHASL